MIMAAKRFNMGPPETTTLSAFPWYKEKLLTKCLKDAKNKSNLSGALDSRRWRFLDVGLNDFRDGYPTHTGKVLLSQGQKGTCPAIIGISNPTFSSDKEPRNRFSKEQACFSKQNPKQQARREHMAAVEHKLKQHSLALYPHLEQGMPSELFDQVTSVLDPDMHVNRTLTVTSPEKGHLVEEEHFADCRGYCESATQESEEEIEERPPSNNIPTDSGPKNPFKGLQATGCTDQEDQIVGVKRLHSQSQDRDIKKVTKLFCDWVALLGGESHNLTESTLLGLFVSGYEKKPTLTFPIKVVEPINMPEELRQCFEELRRDHVYNSLLKDSETTFKIKPGTKRPTYGAWYLDPKKWKKRDAYEPLRDPNAIPEDFNSSDQQNERDEELKQIHGTQAFMHFIISKGLRMPRFLSALFTEEEGENRTRGTSDTVGSASTWKGTVVL